MLLVFFFLLYLYKSTIKPTIININIIDNTGLTTNHEIAITNKLNEVPTKSETINTPLTTIFPKKGIKLAK